MKVVGIIEARMGSSRLPGKVLLPFGGAPALGLLLKRVSSAEKLDEVIVATTEEKGDLPIVRFCDKIGVKSFRGSENDVMKRVLDAARHCEADLVCELMGDSPFLDPAEINRAITEYRIRDCDYLSNFWPKNTYPLGFAVQVYRTEVLAKAETMTLDPVHRSHVTTSSTKTRTYSKSMVSTPPTSVRPRICGWHSIKVKTTMPCRKFSRGLTEAKTRSFPCRIALAS